MALTLTQQILETIKKSNHILITFKKDYSFDGVASAIALAKFLKRMDKLVDVVCDNFVMPKNLEFLASDFKILPKISNLQKFIISLDIKNNEIDEFSYNIENDKLNIFIIPKNGSLENEEITTTTSDYKYNLIFVLDSPDLESLGKIYENATDFFYHTPIINIDHHPANEHFGQINLTNLTATSVAEISFNLIKEISEDYLDSEIATCLLTGLISKTKSFKTSNITPKVLNIASQLISLEADREIIIKNLYRRRSLPTLKLWGRVLARLKSDLGGKLVWSLINPNDFLEAGADGDDLPEVIDELIAYLPQAEIVILIYQKDKTIEIITNTLKENLNALYLTKQFNPSGNKTLARFSLKELSLLEAEKEVIEGIKENWNKMKAGV